MDFPIVQTLDVGKRIYCDGFIGTIMYAGQLPNTKGCWYGVNWDDPARGKHDGCHEDVFYFKTTFPTSGSFVRPHKVNFGSTFVDKFKERYFCDYKGPDQVIQSLLTLPQKGLGFRKIELIGFDELKQKSLKGAHKELCLSNQEIADVGEMEVLAGLFSNITVLDLSKNLIKDLNIVANICKYFNKLKELNLSENRLEKPECPETLLPSFKTLKLVALNKTYFSWEEVLSCLLMWPQVEHLEVWSNNISQISPTYGRLQFLTYLHLGSNPLYDWEKICHLGNLPLLKTLILDSTRLTNISFASTKVNEKTILFPRLKILSLRDNMLSMWKDIAQLHKLAALEELIIGNNPIWNQETAATSRQIVIAKLSALKCLHRSEVTKSERKGAELDYLKRYYRPWLANGGNREQFLNKPNAEFIEEHPTFIHLLSKYGMSDEDEGTTTSSALKNNLIAVDILAPRKNYIQITKKLPVTMTVGKLKVLIKKLFKVPMGDNLNLSYIDKKENEIEIKLDKDLKQLSFYSLANGNQILAVWGA